MCDSRLHLLHNVEACSEDMAISFLIAFPVVSISSWCVDSTNKSDF